MRHAILSAILWTGVTLLMLGGASAVAAMDAGDVVGVWQTAETDKGYSHVEISQDGKKFNGKIIWLKNANYGPEEGSALEGKPKTDRQNPDKGMHDRPIVGLKILDGLTYDGEGEWSGGTIYDPENGKTYKANMKLEGDTLKVRGYIGFSLLGRTTEWTRLEKDG